MTRAGAAIDRAPAACYRGSTVAIPGNVPEAVHSWTLFRNASTSPNMDSTAAKRLPSQERRFTALVRGHQAAIWRYVRFLGSASELADDLVQETFLEVWKKPFREITPDATRAYLRRVARSRFLMAVRRQRARPAFEDLDAAERVWAAHDADDGEAYRNALRACLEELAGKAADVIRLLYREGRSRVEMASLLQMTADGVKTLMRRARASLKECIERKVGA